MTFLANIPIVFAWLAGSAAAEPCLSRLTFTVALDRNDEAR